MKVFLVKLNILKNIPEQVNSLVKLSLEDLKELNFEQFVSSSDTKKDATLHVNLDHKTILFSTILNLESLSLRFYQNVCLKCFSQMRNLVTLVIKESLISEIKTGMFSDLVSLKSLTLSWNCIKIIEPNAFDNMILLENLDMSGNSIERIHPDLLKNFKNLISLDLSFNR